MKSTMKLVGAVPILVGALCLGSLPSARAESDQSSKSLEGTWRVTVTPYNCQSGAPLGVSFHALLAFAQGGTMSSASANPGFQPGQFSAGFGIWKRTGRRTYTAVGDSFILFNGGPFPAGRQEIRHSIHVSADGNQFTDRASVNYFDVNDVPVPPFAPLIPGCATATGQRTE
jgi:hypothetical protein